MTWAFAPPGITPDPFTHLPVALLRTAAARAQPGSRRAVGSSVGAAAGLGYTPVTSVCRAGAARDASGW